MDQKGQHGERQNQLHLPEAVLGHILRRPRKIEELEVDQPEEEHLQRGEPEKASTAAEDEERPQIRRAAGSEKERRRAQMKARYDQRKKRQHAQSRKGPDLPAEARGLQIEGEQHHQRRQEEPGDLAGPVIGHCDRGPDQIGRCDKQGSTAPIACKKRMVFFSIKGRTLSRCAHNQTPDETAAGLCSGSCFRSGIR